MHVQMGKHGAKSLLLLHMGVVISDFPDQSEHVSHTG